MSASSTRPLRARRAGAGRPDRWPSWSRLTGISRATAHRLAVALEVHGLVRRDDDGRFALGARLIALGRAAAAAVPLASAARPALSALRDDTGESVQLYVRDGDRRVCVAALESPHGLRTIVPLGASLPLDRGSAGRLLTGDRSGRGRMGRERGGAGGRGGVGVGAGPGRPRGCRRRRQRVGTHRAHHPPARAAATAPRSSPPPASSRPPRVTRLAPTWVSTWPPSTSGRTRSTWSSPGVERRAATFEVIAHEKEMVRLGSGAGDMKELAPDAIDRGVVALGPVPPGGGHLRRTGHRRGHQRGARGGERRGVPRPGPRRGRGRGRGHLRRRGGPAHPPRRPAGGAGVRAPPAADRHRRGQHRDAGGREERDPGGAQPQAGGDPPHPPLLQERPAPPRRGGRLPALRAVDAGPHGPRGFAVGLRRGHGQLGDGRGRGRDGARGAPGRGGPPIAQQRRPSVGPRSSRW